MRGVAPGTEVSQSAYAREPIVNIGNSVGDNATQAHPKAAETTRNVFVMETVDTAVFRKV